MIKRVLFLALIVGTATAPITMFQRSENQSSANASNGASDASDVNKTGLKLPLVNPRIRVTKSKRQLALYSDEKVVRLYTVGLGFSPKADKARQGDGCTPEGSFYVCVKNAQSSFYLSLGLSYPNKEHAQRGLRDRIITRAQYDEIMSALERRARPPWNTPLGGEIFIHGNGSQSDWTWGCVALDNNDMKELFDAIPKGTNVVIEP
ncbi:MAG: L,D-transpeptidase [Blastocatellia bacterium]